MPEAITRNDGRPECSSAVVSESEDRRRWTFFLTFFVVNAALCLSAAATVVIFDGWRAFLVLDSLTRYYLAGMTVVFAFGFLLSFKNAWWVSSEINFARMRTPPEESEAGRYRTRILEGGDPPTLQSALFARLSRKIALVRFLGGTTLVTLGLVGTVLGFIIALSAVDPDHARDVEMISPIVARLIEGMGLALYTTLVGAVLGAIWLLFLHFLLRGGASQIYETIVEHDRRRDGE